MPVGIAPQYGGTFDLKRLAVVYGGIPLDTSESADGDTLTIEYDTDAWQDMVGAGGAVVRSPTNDARATVTLRLLHNSATLAYLYTMGLTDAVSDLGAKPLNVIDTISGLSYTAVQAWIASRPNWSAGSAPGVREIKFRCASLIHTPAVIPPTPLG